MPDVLLFDCEQLENGAYEMMRRADVGSRIETILMHEFDRSRIEDYRALLISMHADQKLLSRRRERLAHYLEAGGTIVAGGHVAYPYLPGQTPFQPFRDYHQKDLFVTRHADHPVWEGVREEDLSVRRGVSGFYGRGSHALPAGATLIHSIGEGRLPVDFAYSVGAGRVLFHGGNDLWTFMFSGNTAERMVPQLFDWIGRRGNGR